MRTGSTRSRGSPGSKSSRPTLPGLLKQYGIVSTGDKSKDLTLLFEAFASGKRPKYGQPVTRETLDAEHLASKEERKAARKARKGRKERVRLERRKEKLKTKAIQKAYGKVLLKPLPKDPGNDMMYSSLA